jgi:hypothetical protein
MSTIEPLDRAGPVGAGGDGFGEGDTLGAGLEKGVFAAGWDFPDVLNERFSDCLHFKIFRIMDPFYRILLNKLRIP